MDFNCLSSGVIAKKLPLVGFNFEILALVLLQVLNQALTEIIHQESQFLLTFLPIMAPRFV